MPDRIVTGILLTIFLSLTACGPSRLEPLTTPARSGRSAVRLTQSGGFAGIHLIIDVAISGEMTAQDVRSGRAASGMLSSAALKQLHPVWSR
jgi:hypothetical protein